MDKEQTSSLGMWRDSALMTLGIGVANGFNLLYQIGMGRFLSADEFGLLSAGLGLLNMVLLPLGVVALAMTRAVSLLDQQGAGLTIWKLIKQWSLRLGGVGIVVSILIILFADSIRHDFQLERIAPVYLFAGVLCLTLLRPVVFATLRGMECFIAWSSATLILAVGRLIFGVLLVVIVSAYAGWALLGHGLGVGIALVCGVVFIKRQVEHTSKTEVAVPKLEAFIARSIIGLAGLALFTMGDVVLVRRYFPEVSGLFAYASIIGHLILIIPQAMCGALFPKVVKASGYERGQLIRRTFGGMLCLVIGLSTVVALGASFLLGLLFGSEAISPLSVKWLQWVSISMIPVSILQFQVQMALAVHRFNGLGLLMIAALVLIGLLGLSVVDSVEKMMISMALLSLVVSVGLGWCLREREAE
jgi:O-antigen/teichoic acid export membrane protein